MERKPQQPDGRTGAVQRRPRAATGAAWVLAGWLALPVAAGATTAATGARAAAAATVSSPVVRTLARVALPAVRLVREDGARVALPQEIDDGRPVVLDFVYTSCTTVCPVYGQTFARLQQLLGAAAERVHLVSISIDPEADTAATLARYARKFGARPGWDHYTGSFEASLAVQRAFGTFGGDKMSHAPVILVRPSTDAAWVRLAGFARPEDILGELESAGALRAGTQAASLR